MLITFDTSGKFRGELKTNIIDYDLKIISQLNKNSKTSLIFFLETLFLKELALMPWTLKYAKKINS